LLESPAWLHPHHRAERAAYAPLATQQDNSASTLLTDAGSSPEPDASKARRGPGRAPDELLCRDVARHGARDRRWDLAGFLGSSLWGVWVITIGIALLRRSAPGLADDRTPAHAGNRH
jgi:hypothetical protein